MSKYDNIDDYLPLALLDAEGAEEAALVAWIAVGLEYCSEGDSISLKANNIGERLKMPQNGICDALKRLCERDIIDDFRQDGDNIIIRVSTGGEATKNIMSNFEHLTERKKRKIPPTPPYKEKKESIYTRTRENEAPEEAEKVVRFYPPTVEEVAAYCASRKNGIDAQQFIDFYESKGWVVGRSKMKDWQAAVRTWERNRLKSFTRERVPSRNIAKGKNFWD